MGQCGMSCFSHPCQRSGNHAPKCVLFSTLCAKSVMIHTLITYNLIKPGVGVNCNWDGYCSLVNKSSEKRAPKCLHFSILCANGLLFTPSLHKIVSELVGA